jgi:hypothetical protein
VLETYADYSAELTEEERELGFEIVEVQNSVDFPPVQVVAYRFGQCDQIVKMNVPVIGGHSYRHERLKARDASAEMSWMPVGSVVFPTASQAVEGLGAATQMQFCH